MASTAVVVSDGRHAALTHTATHYVFDTHAHSMWWQQREGGRTRVLEDQEQSVHRGRQLESERAVRQAEVERLAKEGAERARAAEETKAREAEETKARQAEVDAKAAAGRKAKSDEIKARKAKLLADRFGNLAM